MDVGVMLKGVGIQPSAQRVAVGEFVFQTSSHPTADQVFRSVKERFSSVSRATIYNTLNVFVDKGLLRQLSVNGQIRYDSNRDPHHHFVDSETGDVVDILWDKLSVQNLESLSEFEIFEYQVVLQGRRKAPQVNL